MPAVIKKRWTDEEHKLLASRWPSEGCGTIADDLGRSRSSVYQMANILGLEKSEEYLKSSVWFRPGARPSPSTEFKKGQTPANKGLRRPGWSPGRMHETQFKKGALNGTAKLLWRPVGATRITHEGYLERKHSDAPGLHGKLRWELEHRLLWQEHLGPVPPGHKVIFKNGDRADIRIDNLALVSCSALMRKNSYHQYPKEIALAVQLKGALTRAIRNQSKKENK